MQILHLIPGAGNTFYCENCLRDHAMVKALREAGHDALMVPLYLPIMTDIENRNKTMPVFYGGINVFLQQKIGLFRKTPRWIDKWFDAPALLKWAANLSGMTRAEDLAETTLSMLSGENGRQTKELERMIYWMKQHFQPDIVLLANSLLLGFAEPVKKALDTKVICMLQDEDIFVDPLPEYWRNKVWALMAEKARDADGFIAVSSYFSSFMREKLGIPESKITTVHTGINASVYPRRAPLPEIPVIGFLDRQCREKGLHDLISAYILLRKNNPKQKVLLRIAGGNTADDIRYIKKSKNLLRRHGYLQDAEFLSNLSMNEKFDFLAGLTVLSVPARHREAFGLYIIEANAAGVPVVQPAHGAFPEILEKTQGGLLCTPDNPEALAAMLQRLIDDQDMNIQLGQAGKNNVQKHFRIEDSAAKVLSFFAAMLRARKGVQNPAV